MTVLPESVIGSPNSFGNYAEAETIRDAMAHATAKDKTTIRYVVLPAIDDALIEQARAISTPQASPARPTNPLTASLFAGHGPRRETPA